MKDKELIEKAINWFKTIEERSSKLTTGNVAHNSQHIKGLAHRAAEYLEKNLKINQ